MRYALRMTEAQHQVLEAHLFPGDNLEAAALILCGRRNGKERHIFTAHEIVPIPHDECDRRSDRITWPTDYVDQVLNSAFGKDLAIVKAHSHTTYFPRFSGTDDDSDAQLFASVTSLLDDRLPHASVIMQSDGSLIGRAVGDEGKFLGDFESIMVAGDEIKFWSPMFSGPRRISAAGMRHAQAFGDGTAQLLRTLSVAVVGCSGTGSVVAEQLARLGVGRLVLVDPDNVEEKNLNRILNSGKEDAYLSRPKVHVLASAIARMGLDQEVCPIHGNLIDKSAVEAVAECDVVFGCMDGVEGRHWLNRIATYYTLPYFDVGIRLDADGVGGISQISGAIHYIRPGGSSLFSRGVYDMERVDAEAMRRTNPEMYRQRLGEGYIRGVDEDRPAVISVNMLFASLVVHELLARLHCYRNLDNAEYAYVGGNLCEMQLFTEVDGKPCNLLAKHVGRGDMTPLLDRVELS